MRYPDTSARGFAADLSIRVRFQTGAPRCRRDPCSECPEISLPRAPQISINMHRTRGRTSSEETKPITKLDPSSNNDRTNKPPHLEGKRHSARTTLEITGSNRTGSETCRILPARNYAEIALSLRKVGKEPILPSRGFSSRTIPAQSAIPAYFSYFSRKLQPPKFFLCNGAVVSDGGLHP